jgi:NAD(P)-dependent dehydrogenase (short-subunit alcohol dehydrogenase family)
MTTSSAIAVVTGGASGIGAACAAELADRGYLVIVVDVNADAAAQRAKAIGGVARVADVSDEHQMDKLAADIWREFGAVDALVANAGVLQLPLPPHELSMADYDRVMSVDLRGVYVTCRAFGTLMARHGAGAIVTISSCAAFLSTPLHAYGPAKAAVVAMTATLAAEWGRSGVRVNGVAPAYTLTEGLKERGARGERDLSRFGSDLLLGRAIEPSEIAKPVAFLLSSDASAVTGVTLPVDGGLIASGVWPSYGGIRGAYDAA